MRLSASGKAAIRLVWDRQQSQLQLLGQEWEQLQQQLQQLHLLQLQSNRRFEKAIRELPALLSTLNVAERSRQEKKAVQQQQQQQQQQQVQQQAQQAQQQQVQQQQAQQQEVLFGNTQAMQAGCLQQQQAQQQFGQQQQQQPVDPALTDLLTCWRQQTFDSSAMEDGLMAELASELLQERQLQQQVQTLLQEQQQQSWNGRPGGRATPPPLAGAGVAVGVAAAATPPPPPQQQQQFSPAEVLGSSPETTSRHSQPADAAQNGFARAAVEGAYTELGAAEEVLLQVGALLCSCWLSSIAQQQVLPHPLLWHCRLPPCRHSKLPCGNLLPLHDTSHTAACVSKGTCFA
jgi:hypothetical protein